MSRRPPTTVTMKIADNPLAGLPGQVDYTITVSSEPDLPFKSGDPLPDPDDMPLSILAATAMLAHIAGLSYEAAFINVMGASEN